MRHATGHGLKMASTNTLRYDDLGYSSLTDETRANDYTDTGHTVHMVSACYRNNEP